MKYGGSGYNDPQCLSAWQEIPKAGIVAVIDAVRNKLLEFVLKIEVENPDAGEAPPDAYPVAPEKVQQLVNYYIGPVGNVAQQSQNLTQAAHIGIRPQELSTLVTELTKHLDELHLDTPAMQKAEAMIATLKAQLTTEPDPTVVQQAGRTLRSIIEGAIGSLLATATAQPQFWLAIQALLARFG